jgi:2-oxoglutaroyl-CoA hydrolase
MTDISPLLPALPRELDGFRVEIDPAHERGDIVLDRPPLNVITMVEREQLRVAFEILDADPGVRVIVLRAMGEHFSSDGEIGGFLEASPEHASRLTWNIAAPARCSKPAVRPAIGASPPSLPVIVSSK